ncbi:MAG: 2,3-bisphosphoglycerate-dependent phosphoglycerate mutase [Acidimicrobiales bacterium]
MNGTSSTLFTGWYDCPLIDKGRAEARRGLLLIEAGLLPDVVHTSLQQRAIETAEIVLAGCDRRWIPVRRSWRLNERHYGDLTGLDKAATRSGNGDRQLQIWRRSYDATTADPRRQRVQPEHVGRLRRPSARAPAAHRVPVDVVTRLLPTGTTRSSPTCGPGVACSWPRTATRRALVKHLGRDPRRRDRRAQHPHRHAAALPPRRHHAAGRRQAPARAGARSEAVGHGCGGRGSGRQGRHGASASPTSLSTRRSSGGRYGTGHRPRMLAECSAIEVGSTG